MQRDSATPPPAAASMELQSVTIVLLGLCGHKELTVAQHFPLPEVDTS